MTSEETLVDHIFIPTSDLLCQEMAFSAGSCAHGRGQRRSIGNAEIVSNPSTILSGS